MCNKNRSIKNAKNFMRPLWYLLRNIILKKRLGKTFNELTCIETGNYKVLLSEKIIIYKDSTQPFVKQFEIFNKAFSKHLPSIKIKKSKSLNTTFCGQIVMLTTNSTLKIFDIVSVGRN